MTNQIEVGSLVKVYPDGTRAVDDVTFDVEAGELFGFLGPNGAGKTTAIRILVTLLPKTSGIARVGGHDVARDPEPVRRMIGYAGQFIGVDVDLTRWCSSTSRPPVSIPRPETRCGSTSGSSTGTGPRSS